MKITNHELIAELKDILGRSKRRAFDYLSLSESTLNKKSDEKSWSVLECLEHLNLYGDFYIPEINKRLENASNDGSSTLFQSGLLGNYFAEVMQVKNGKINKMSSPKDKNPNNSMLSTQTIDKFIIQCDKLETLLNRATNVDLTKTKTAISLSPLIKLRLGDTFRVVVYHIERHIAQADRTLTPE